MQFWIPVVLALLFLSIHGDNFTQHITIHDNGEEHQYRITFKKTYLELMYHKPQNIYQYLTQEILDRGKPLFYKYTNMNHLAKEYVKFIKSHRNHDTKKDHALTLFNLQEKMIGNNIKWQNQKVIFF